MGQVILSEKERLFARHIGAEVKLLDGGTGINLGLYFPESFAAMDKLEANGVNVYFPQQRKIYVQNFNQVELIPSGAINGAEAKPMMVERFADNGAHSHWELINPADGALIWSEEQLNPMEALFGFTGWLTTREEAITLSGKHNAGAVVELITEFSKVNKMPEVRKEWPDMLIGMGKPKEGNEEGDICNRDGCIGIMAYPKSENCSCHISAPCSECTNKVLTCQVCGAEAE